MRDDGKEEDAGRGRGENMEVHRKNTGRWLKPKMWRDRSSESMRVRGSWRRKPTCAMRKRESWNVK